MERFIFSIGKLSLIAGSLSLIPYTFVYDIDGGERCVMFNRFGGVSEKTYGEGSHFYIPWFQTPFIYDIKTKPKVINTTTGTKDLQMVTISLRLLYRPYINKLPYLHSNLGPDYDDRVLPSIGNEVLKAVVAKYNAESLLTQRDKISKEIQENIKNRSKQFNIVLDDVAITHLSYGKEFAKAIEDKQVAQQESERVKFIVAKTEQEKKAAIIKAQGEAHAAALISNAIKQYGNSLIQIRKLEAIKEIAENLSKSKNIMYFPSSSNILLNPKNI